MLEFEQYPTKGLWVTEAPNWDGGAGLYKVAVSPEAIKERADRGLRAQLGQMYGVLGHGLISVQHVFEGLRRDMYVKNDKQAADKKLAATWAAKVDYYLEGEKSSPRLAHSIVKDNRVFVVYISRNDLVTEFPDIAGWADHWAWIAADSQLEGAPVEWQERYDRKLWSRT